jgi:hypothetical protein
MLFTDGQIKRECANCHGMFRPRVSGQRYCRTWCRVDAKAAEGRAARRAWWRAGRPMQFEDQQREQT